MIGPIFMHECVCRSGVLAPRFPVKTPNGAAKATMPMLFMKDDWVKMSNQMNAKVIGVFQNRSLDDVKTMGTQLLVATKAYDKAVFIKLSDIFHKLAASPEDAFSQEELQNKIVKFSQDHVAVENAGASATVLLLQSTQQLSWNVV